MGKMINQIPSDLIYQNCWIEQEDRRDGNQYDVSWRVSYKGKHYGWEHRRAFDLEDAYAFLRQRQAIYQQQWDKLDAEGYQP